MNKKIAVGIGIAVVAIAIATVGIKTIAGDKALALPGEEKTENALHLQESQGASSATNASTTESGGSSESSESGP
ncbi:MAG: hypothetical protein KGI25_05160 [Thaumarchaeota archaeon]|nr:hypothetical protein [Nitrososphaerota archaeon]